MSFADFSKQEQVVQLLQRSLDRGRMAHGYLFAGHSLDELEAVARTLAQSLNCLAPPKRGPTGIALDCCDQCANCRKIREGAFPDVVVVRPESKSRVVTIDQIRSVMERIYLRSNDGAFKVVIMAAADRLNESAANAFLKTLEEPPPRCLIVLLSTEPQRVLDTILSRCLRLTFAGEARIAAQPEDAAWVETMSREAALTEAGLLGRYRLLATLLTRLAEIKVAVEEQLTARSPLGRYDDLEPKLRDKWEAELSAAVEAEYRRRRSELLAAWQGWLRDVWIQSMSLGSELLTWPQLAAWSATVAARVVADEAMENLQTVERLQRQLATNAQEALVLEVGLLRLRL